MGTHAISSCKLFVVQGQIRSQPIVWNIHRLTTAYRRNLDDTAALLAIRKPVNVGIISSPLEPIMPYSTLCFHTRHINFRNGSDRKRLVHFWMPYLNNVVLHMLIPRSVKTCNFSVSHEFF